MSRYITQGLSCIALLPAWHTFAGSWNSTKQTHAVKHIRSNAQDDTSKCCPRQAHHTQSKTFWYLAEYDTHLQERNIQLEKALRPPYTPCAHAPHEILYGMYANLCHSPNSTVKNLLTASVACNDVPQWRIPYAHLLDPRRGITGYTTTSLRAIRDDMLSHYHSQVQAGNVPPLTQAEYAHLIADRSLAPHIQKEGTLSANTNLKIALKSYYTHAIEFIAQNLVVSLDATEKDTILKNQALHKTLKQLCRQASHTQHYNEQLKQATAYVQARFSRTFPYTIEACAQRLPGKISRVLHNAPQERRVWDTFFKNDKKEAARLAKRPSKDVASGYLIQDTCKLVALYKHLAAAGYITPLFQLNRAGPEAYLSTLLHKEDPIAHLTPNAKDVRKIEHLRKLRSRRLQHGRVIKYENRENRLLYFHDGRLAAWKEKLDTIEKTPHDTIENLYTFLRWYLIFHLERRYYTPYSHDKKTIKKGN